MKINRILMILVLFFLGLLQAQDRFNPPYPRTIFFSCWGEGGGGHPVYSVGTWPQLAARFDILTIEGRKDGVYIGQKMRELNPNQILFTLAVRMYTGDPPDFFLYRSYRGFLKRDIVPGQREIYVDTANGAASGLQPGNYYYCYIVIDNDVIKVNNIPNDTTFIVVDNPNDDYAVNVPHSAGAMVRSIIRDSGPGVVPNFSEFCPVVDGKQSWDYLVDKFLRNYPNWDNGLYDGVFFDFFTKELWYESWTVDFDNNGVDDYVEHGRNWVNQRWAHGRDLWLLRLREAMIANAPSLPNLIFLNNGGPLDQCYSLAHGHIFEGFLKWGGSNPDNYRNYFVPDYLAWMQNGLKPSVMSIQDFIPEKWAADGKERFWKMRFGLATACIYEMYYGIAYGYNFNVAQWYDEFETNLGYPVDNQIITLPNGLVLRYFTNGVAVCNPTGQTQTLNASDLVGGPYYRLKGGQDPVHNNGQLFDTMQLWGLTVNPGDWRGDGILLFRQPTTSVADIIIDNFDLNDTSPASNPVELTGNWIKKVTKGSVDLSLINPYYVQDTSKLNDDSYGYHAVAPGQGEATATYRPTIGVPGWYEVSEWHGWHGDYIHSSQEATNVPYEIVVNGEVKLQGIINQQINIGQWNRLGYVQLPKGTNSYVRITNKANGVVIADAMRFHYMGDNYEPDLTPPQPPKNVRIQQLN